MLETKKIKVNNLGPNPTNKNMLKTKKVKIIN